MADKQEKQEQELFRVDFEKVGAFVKGDVVGGPELGDEAGVKYLLSIGAVSPSKAKARSVAADRTASEVEKQIDDAVKDKAEELSTANAKVASLEAEVAKLKKANEDALAHIEKLEKAAEAKSGANKPPTK